MNERTTTTERAVKAVEAAIASPAYQAATNQIDRFDIIMAHLHALPAEEENAR